MAEEPIQEPEVTDSWLEKIGCPYRLPEFDKINIWLDGYKKGLHRGGEIAKECARETFAELKRDLGNGA